MGATHCSSCYMHSSESEPIEKYTKALAESLEDSIEKKIHDEFQKQ